MKKSKHIIILATAICLASVGLNAQAENVSKKVIKDLNAKDSGSILMSIYCMLGSGYNK
jgi:hypothetical protein